MKKKQIRYAHGIDKSDPEALIIIRRRRRFSVDEWVAEDPAHRSRLMLSDRRYKALRAVLWGDGWRGNTITVER